VTTRFAVKTFATRAGAENFARSFDRDRADDNLPPLEVETVGFKTFAVIDPVYPTFLLEPRHRK
jgi:hypothetical protein